MPFSKRASWSVCQARLSITHIVRFCSCYFLTSSDCMLLYDCKVFGGSPFCQTGSCGSPGPPRTTDTLYCITFSSCCLDTTTVTYTEGAGFFASSSYLPALRCSNLVRYPEFLYLSDRDGYRMMVAEFHKKRESAKGKHFHQRSFNWYI